MEASFLATLLLSSALTPTLSAPLAPSALSALHEMSAPPALSAHTPAASFATFELARVAIALPANPMVSQFALDSRSITAPRTPRRKKPRKGESAEVAPAPVANPDQGLGPDRARILLRSLTVPGWGQGTLGHSGSARTFLLLEAGIWGAFTAFRVQQAQRTESYLLTARLSAGVDLRQRDDEFLRIVGAFASSEEYNLLVVSRDAANQYLSDPATLDIAAYRRYIAEHSLSGDLAWAWTDEQSFRRYRDQRQLAQKAGLRANSALGLAIANRLVSALHAARLAGRSAHSAKAHGWRLDLEPGLAVPGTFRAALTRPF